MKLKCEMMEGCPQPVAYLDIKGYVYCSEHGHDRRRNTCPCRQLRPHELRKLERGERLTKY